jgi:GNAT superfamily N-acetyltransferase
VPVLSLDQESADACPLWCVKIGDTAAVTVRSDLVEGLRPVVAGLPPDLVCSELGAYEMGRVTLPEGFGVWGPTWYLFADQTDWKPVGEHRPVQTSPSDLTSVDRKVFWHNFFEEPIAGFAIYEGGGLAALATVRVEGEPVWEIGMDVSPEAKRRGLGRAVVGAAARWIIDSGRVALATVGTFNIPSARTMRSLGLRYLLTDMKAMMGPHRVPPQTLGQPIPGSEVLDYYPRWAMNKNIKPRDGA